MSDLMLQSLWTNPQQAGASLNQTIVPWAKSMLLAGHRLAVEIRLADDAKTDQQRKYYHGVILKQIAEQAAPGGVKHSLQIWKEYFRAEYLGFKTTTYTNPLTSKKSRRRVRKSTEDLGVKAYAALIERVTAFAVTDLGVQFAENIDPETGEIINHH